MFHMDRSKVRRIGWLANNLEDTIGRVYRKFLGTGGNFDYMSQWARLSEG